MKEPRERADRPPGGPCAGHSPEGAMVSFPRSHTVPLQLHQGRLWPGGLIKPHHFSLRRLFTLAQAVVNLNVPEAQAPGWKKPSSAACEGWKGAGGHPGTSMHPPPITVPSTCMGVGPLGPAPAADHSTEVRGLAATLHTRWWDPRRGAGAWWLLGRAVGRLLGRQGLGKTVSPWGSLLT